MKSFHENFSRKKKIILNYSATPQISLNISWSKKKVEIKKGNVWTKKVTTGIQQKNSQKSTRDCANNLSVKWIQNNGQ